MSSRVEAPLSWERRPLGSLFTERNEYGSEEDFPALSVTRDGVVPRIENVALSLNGSARKVVRAGDFVINSRSDRKGSSGIARNDGSVSVISIVLEPREGDARFWHHLLRSRWFQEEFYRWGSGIVDDLWSTRYQAMKRIELAVPSVEEQRRIADYLDRQTTTIDNLVEKQQHLLDRLKERQGAVVAREFESDKWKPLSSVLESSQTGPFGTQLQAIEYVIGGVSVLNPSHIVRGELAPDDMISVSEGTAHRLSRFQVRGGDILLGRKGEVDKAAIVSPLLAGSITGSDSLRLRADERQVDPQFLWWWLQSPVTHSALDRLSVGSTVTGLNQRIIRQLRVPNLPLDEQRRIADHLDQETAKIDALIAKAERFIELARERRAALITAAVTGQISVD